MSKQISIFLVGKLVPTADVVHGALSRHLPLELTVSHQTDPFQALLEMERAAPDIAILDSGLVGFSALKFVTYLKDQYPDCEILVTGDLYRDHDKLEQALELGASDILLLPAQDRLPLEARLGTCIDKLDLKRRVQDEQRLSEFPALVGGEGALRRTLRRIRALSPLAGTCLLIGEAGSGRKTIATLICELASSSPSPSTYVYLPNQSKGELDATWQLLTTSENRHRLFYFDGLEGMSTDGQRHLYGLMKETGNTARTPPLVMAAQPVLLEKVRKETFLPELFHLIAQYCFIIPPLRDRKEDFGRLIDHMSRLCASDAPSLLSLLSKDAYTLMEDYTWPGNLHELRQVVTHCMSVYQVTGRTIEIGDLPPFLLSGSAYTLAQDEEKDLLLPYREAKEKNLAKFHENYIIYLLKRAKGNISAAALEAGLDRSNFKKIMQKYRIRPELFR